MIAFSIPEVLTFIKSWISYWKNRYKHQKKNDDDETERAKTNVFQKFVDKIKNFILSSKVELRRHEEENFDEFSYFNWIFVSATETLHVVGLSLLIFYIFPELDVVKGVMLTNCICLIPGIMNLASTLKEMQKSKEMTSIIKLCLDLVCLLAQITGFLIFPLTETKLKLWAIPVSLFLISLHYWENFVNVKENVLGQNMLKDIKKNIDAIGYTYYKFVSLWKIIVFFLMAMLLNNYNGVPVDMFFKLQDGFGAHDINITEVSSYSSYQSLYFQFIFGYRILTPRKRKDQASTVRQSMFICVAQKRDSRTIR